MWAIECASVHRERQELAELGVEAVLVVSHGQLGILGCVTESVKNLRKKKG